MHVIKYTENLEKTVKKSQNINPCAFHPENVFTILGGSYLETINLDHIGSVCWLAL